MSTPNSWTTVYIENNWGEEITNVTLKHRYDTDHYDEKSWNTINNGEHSDSMTVGFWTGFGRTGRDYWQISFEADGLIWTCKDNFYCFLTSDDVNKNVICRLYKDGNNGKMDVICPVSSGCTVSVVPNVPVPNSRANVQVQNDWGQEITQVELNHRYDNTHYDEGHWDKIGNGESSSAFEVGFWTGFGRTGRDYWLIAFEANGILWTCKDNFYCFLTADDVNGNVICRLYQDAEGGKMEIIPPVSSSCVVRLTSVSIPSEENRPTYIIGHACNNSGDIGMAISKGCNAVECDLQYDTQSGQLFVNHDFPSGTLLSTRLDNAHNIMSLYPSRFSLIVFDCKFAAKFDTSVTSQILQDLQSQVRSRLNGVEKKPINTLFSIADQVNIESFTGIMENLLPNEGIAIDQSDHPEDVEKFFGDNLVNNCWYGDGIFVAGTKDVYPHIKRGCELRDTNGVLKKVYVWTLAKESSIYKYVNEAEIDGLMVNVPGVSPFTGLKQALKVISESNKSRMAVRKDNAFIVHQKKVSL